MSVTRRVRRIRLLPALALGVVLLAAHGTARADSIPPPPACPPGSRGLSSHAGERCVPATCQSDADCKDLKGTTCRRWRVCVRTHMVPAGGRRGGEVPPRAEDLAVGSCPVEKGCTGDEEPPPLTAGKANPGPPHCLDADYCVPQALPPLPTSSPGKGDDDEDEDDEEEDGEETSPAAGCCKCHLGARQDGQGWLMALGLALLALRRRRS
ncbi:MAG: hypothetical protein JRI68_23615 [Deltaproteobacteria bacterium]|nr:hypothetical protein [Deltaproteobacteria bacterium]